MPEWADAKLELSFDMIDQPAQRPVLDDFYREFLNNERSADFVYAVSQHYTLASLRRLASSGQRMTRRAAVLAIGFLGDVQDNQLLGRAMSDRDRGVRLLADHGIRQVWFRVGNSGMDSGLRRLVRLNQQGQYASAIELASELIDTDPEVAECWNQRAAALYEVEDFAHSLCDYRRTLELNPYHFLAALGAGNCHLELGEVYEALEHFRQAVEINPDLEMVRTQIDHLQRIVEGR